MRASVGGSSWRVLGTWTQLPHASAVAVPAAPPWRSACLYRLARGLGLRRADCRAGKGGAGSGGGGEAHWLRMRLFPAERASDVSGCTQPQPHWREAGGARDCEACYPRKLNRPLRGLLLVRATSASSSFTLLSAFTRSERLCVSFALGAWRHSGTPLFRDSTMVA